MFVSSLGISIAHCVPNCNPLKSKHGKCNKMVGDSHSGGFRPPQTKVPVTEGVVSVTGTGEGRASF